MSMNGIHSINGLRPMAMDAEGIASGMAFLVGELEKRDPMLLEPLTSVTWMRDIVAQTGGGYVDFTSNYFVDYATSGADENGIISGETNNIPILQANISKDVFKVFPWANNIKIPFLDQARMGQIGRSLDQIYNDGLTLNYNKTLDKNLYTGFSKHGTYGLVNNPAVTAGFAPVGAGGFTQWSTKTAEEILADVDHAIERTWAASNYDLSGMANHILIPPVQFADINRRVVSVSSGPGSVTAGAISIMKYLMQNNIAASQGRSFAIVPCRQCIGAGLPLTVGGPATDRMVVYVNAANRTTIDLPVPLTRAMTMPDVNQLAYLTAYLAYIGQLKILYYQTIEYTDGI